MSGFKSVPQFTLECINTRRSIITGNDSDPRWLRKRLRLTSVDLPSIRMFVKTMSSTWYCMSTFVSPAKTTMFASYRQRKTTERMSVPPPEITVGCGTSSKVCWARREAWITRTADGEGRSKCLTAAEASLLDASCLRQITDTHWQKISETGPIFSYVRLKHRRWDQGWRDSGGRLRPRTSFVVV